MSRDPCTIEEWQAAVNAAHAMLLLDAARQYGLVTCRLKADVARCSWILEQGRRRRFVPAPDAVERFFRREA